MQRSRRNASRAQKAKDRLQEDMNESLYDEGDVYTYVDDDEYSKIVQERTKKGQFVVEDEEDGHDLGYYDDGEEHIFDSVEDNHQKSDGLNSKLSKKLAKKGVQLENEKLDSYQHRIDQMFSSSRGNDTILSSRTLKQEPTKNLEESEIDNLINELDDDAVTNQKSTKRPSMMENSVFIGKQIKKEMKSPKEESIDIDIDIDTIPSEDAPFSFDSTPHIPSSSLKNTENIFQDLISASNVKEEHNSGADLDISIQTEEQNSISLDEPQDTKDISRDEKDEDNNNMNIKQENDTNIKKKLFSDLFSAPSTLKAAKMVEMPVKKDDTPLVNSIQSPIKKEKTIDLASIDSALNEVQLSTNTINTNTINTTINNKKNTPVSTTNGIDIYWYDLYEDPFNHGNLCIFGKMKKDSQFVSVCVRIESIERELYVLPREKANGERYSFNEVKSELRSKIAALCNNDPKLKLGFKKEVKKYAFELPNIPKETEYVMAVYPFSKPVISETSGKTYEYIFGLHTSASELFLLQNDLSGPSYIHINNVTVSNSPSSFAKLEFTVPSIDNISVLPPSPSLPIPSLRTMAIYIRTIYNPKTSQQDIIMISAAIHDNVSITEKTKNESNLRHLSVINTPEGIVFPLSFKNQIKEIKNIGSIELVNNERSLLSYFLNIYKVEDIDMIIGHNLQANQLDVFINKCKQYNIPTLFNFGRLKRNIKVKSLSSSPEYIMPMVFSGRLVCDVYTLSRELIKESEYTLTSLAKTQLDINRNEIDDERVISMFSSSTDLITLIKNNIYDTMIIYKLLFHLQIIPLTHQITTISGNIWNNTLKSSRKDRVESLLLHQFSKLNYIVPDPLVKKSREKRKSGYEGGLVLDPISGLYDSYILVLDFNSLYPSIIQEFHICYTTVDRKREGEKEEEEKKEIEDNQENQENNDEMTENTTNNQENGILKKDIEIYLNQLKHINMKNLNLAPLPSVIRSLVQRRRAVKQELKKPENSVPEKQSQLNIKQLAFKILANSMYGCLGYVNSRFHASILAAMITAKIKDR
ncbi:hypothetical protein WA158_004219 [Blastocystis sp. Blastoise]